MAHWFYGRQSVCEILKSGQSVRKLFISKEIDTNSISQVRDLAEEMRVPFERVSKKFLDSLVQGNHQGVAVQVDSFKTAELKTFLENIDKGGRHFVCLLDEIQDPQNLGAIIRSAACFGCSGAIIPTWRSASVTESVMKSSSGAAAHLPVVEIPNLGVAIERLKEKGFFIYGADMEGEKISSLQFDFPLAIVFGNEHRGIKPVLKKACDKLVSIPQTGGVASLNVSAAAAIFFYEIAGRLNLQKQRDILDD